MLKRFGGRSNKAAVTTIVSCKKGRVQEGSRCIVLSGAEKPDLEVNERALRRRRRGGLEDETEPYGL